VFKFLDSDYFPLGAQSVLSLPKKTNTGRWLPFVFLHLICFGIFWVGCSAAAIALAVSLYMVRMFAITAFYHRYFSHRTFKTSRIAQFIFALIGLSAVQRGPLWWAAHHRKHHRFADKEKDVHSPIEDSFLWAHIGWITSDHNMPTDYEQIRDLTRFPELVWLNRFDWLVPVASACIIYFVGEYAGKAVPGSQVTGAQLVVWSFISTVCAFHATASINSIAHLFGTRRFDTVDNSKNNFLLAIFTFGEGWHNNHHRFPSSARQGLMWWEIDVSYYILQLMQCLGIIWDLQIPTAAQVHGKLPAPVPAVVPAVVPAPALIPASVPESASIAEHATVTDASSHSTPYLESRR
jgi:stearoyl-CoA desaturase (delta-9 desaturase)